MGFLDFLTRKTDQTNGTNGFSHASSGFVHENGQPEIPRKVFIEGDEPQDQANVKTADDTSIDNNLEVLHRFLEKSYEDEGYDDALRNPDSTHHDENVQALRNELSRKIKQVKTFYEDFTKEIDFHIESRSRKGMIDTVEELKMKRSIAQSHIEKILIIEEDVKNKRGDSEGIIISYSRGFKNGLAAISHHNIMRKKF
jgi:hypothetical protein